MTVWLVEYGDFSGECEVRYVASTRGQAERYVEAARDRAGLYVSEYEVDGEVRGE